MRKITSRGSSLFLLELMISIVFFAIAAAGCVQMFAKAHTLSTEAEKLDQAVSMAQSLVEENSGQNAESGIWYYDSQGEVCGKAEAAYQAEVTVQTLDQMRKIQVVITDATKYQMAEREEDAAGTESEADLDGSLNNADESVIYQLETAVYCPGETDTQTGGRDE